MSFGNATMPHVGRHFITVLLVGGGDVVHSSTMLL
jgi:hypothetical protein